MWNGTEYRPQLLQQPCWDNEKVRLIFYFVLAKRNLTKQNQIRQLTVIIENWSDLSGVCSATF